MKLVELTVDGSNVVAITVNEMATGINILGYYQSDTLTVNVDWTSIPAGLIISSARYQVRASETSADVIDISCTVTADGHTGTASVTFQLAFWRLAANQTYLDYLSMTNDSGFSKTWKGYVRALAG